MKISSRVYLKFCELLIIIYSVLDILNSASAGNSNSNRSIVYVSMIVTIILMFLYCIIKPIKLEKEIPLYILLFIFTIVINSVLKSSLFSWDTYILIGMLIWWILSYLFFKELYSKDSYDNYLNFLRIMFIIYTVAIIYGSINIRSNTAVSFARVGYIYHLLSILPGLLFMERKKYKIVWIFLAGFLTFFSLKRGAIIALVLMLFVFYIVDGKIKRLKVSLKPFLCMIVLAIAALLIDKFTDGYLSSRFSYDELSDGSGRFEMAATVFSNLSTRNIFELLFGFASSNEIFVSVHNEWLRCLSSYGIIGLIVYLTIILSIISFNLRLIKSKNSMAPYISMISIYIIWIIQVSGFIFMYSALYTMLILGFAKKEYIITQLGIEKNENRNINLSIRN